MIFQRILPFSWLWLAWVLLALGMESNAETLNEGQYVPTFWLNHHEGGSIKARHQDALARWFQREHCPLKIELGVGKKKDAAFLFDVREKKSNEFSRLWLRARTDDPSPLTVHWLVKSSLFLEDLSSLKGERVALFDEQSLSGYQLPMRLLLKSGVSAKDISVYGVSEYQGAMALLLHGDVMAAAFPSPLMSRWSDKNSLVSLGISDVTLISGIWLMSELNKETKKACKKAFLKLSRNSRRDQKMRVFPEWLIGFEAVTLHNR